MSIVIRTARLFLRSLQRADIDALHHLWPHTDVRRYVWDDNIISCETVAAVVTSSIADWSTHQYGFWSICFPESAELIGFCGFRSGEDSQYPELLYALAPTSWRQRL